MARARARSGEPPATGDEELVGGAGESRPRGAISRYYGGSDVYMRRRVIAVGLVILAALLIFLIVGGC